jgi:hypothetical protein
VLTVGIVGVMSGGFIVNATGKYKATVAMLCLGFMISLVVFNFVLDSGSDWLLYLNGAALGMFLAPSLTIGIELACEVGFPVGEAYSNGFIQIVGNVLGIVFSVGLPLILDSKLESRSYYLIFIIIGLTLIGLIALLAMTETLNRSIFESNSGAPFEGLK